MVEAGYLCVCLDKQHDPDNHLMETGPATEVGSGGILKVHADLSGQTFRDIGDKIEYHESKLRVAAEQVKKEKD